MGVVGIGTNMHILGDSGSRSIFIFTSSLPPYPLGLISAVHTHTGMGQSLGHENQTVTTFVKKTDSHSCINHLHKYRMKIEFASTDFSEVKD